jgi:hypothetical protein
VETPPEIDGDVFGYSFNGAIHVLCNKEGTYKITSNWDSYAGKIVGDVSPDITLESADETMGKPAVTKENTCADNTATIEAAANPGYRFVQWNDGNTANPRTVPVEEDVTFIATFAPAEPPQVANPPVLLQDLEDAIICRGESHTFKIVAEGDNLSYEWYYGNERIKGANGNTYTITNAELRDYERYYVIVRNLVGESRASVYSKNVRLWVADQLPETLSFVSCPVQAITGQTYPIKLSGYPDVTQYSWSYRVGATLVAAQDAVAPTTVAPDTNDGVTFSPATGGVGQNETLATFGALSAGQGLLTVTLEHPCGARQVTQAIEVQYPTGVDQVAETAVRVFPNPTSGIIKVSGTTSNQIIRIVDVTGSL